MTKRYKNKVHRSLNDMSWMGDDDGYEYAGPHKLRRNKIDGMVGGVCAGIADYIGIDPAIVRVATVFLMFSGLPIVVYLILWVCIPSDSRAPYRREYREAREAKKKTKRRKNRGDDEEFRPVRTASFRDVKSKFRSLEVRLQDLERSITSKEWQLRRQFRDLEN